MQDPVGYLGHLQSGVHRYLDPFEFALSLKLVEKVTQIFVSQSRIPQKSG